MDHSLKFSDDYIGLESHLLIPLGIYFVWQIGYLLMTGKISSRSENIECIFIFSPFFRGRVENQIGCRPRLRY